MKRINNILYFIFIILLYNLTKNDNIFLLTISFSLFLIYKGIFSSFSIRSVISDYYQKKKYYSIKMIYRYSIVSVLLIGISLLLISYVMAKIINIDYLFIVNIFMVLAAVSNVIIKITGEYFECCNYKKIGNNLCNIYNFSNVVLQIILSIFLFKVFNLNVYISISILYFVYTFILIIFMILLYLFVFRKNKYNRNKDEYKINYIKDLKKIIITDKTRTICNIVKFSYVYLSIIVLYYILFNKYNYSYDDLSNCITNTYFYGIIFMYFIYLIIKKKYDNKFLYLKSCIDNKDKNIENKFFDFFNRIINNSLSFVILMMVISGPICYLLLGSRVNFLFDLFILLFIYILFDYIIENNISFNKDKNVIIVLISGLFAKILFDTPLINSAYRMGYSLVFGSILSNVLGLIVSIVIGLIILKKKFKFNLLNNFNDILNIIYENIIFCLVLVLFTFIVDVKANTFISSLLVIVFYVFITFIFNKIKSKINVKMQ